MVPRAGVEPARPFGQRTLSSLDAISLNADTRDHVVFIDVSAVKANSRLTWFHNIVPHVSLISETISPM